MHAPAGFLLGATAGRTTLLGEGLQHQDGHSLVLASTVPTCQAYDPAFAYEMATVVKHGLKRMYGPQPEDVFYYLTLYNENYPMPPMPTDVEAGHHGRPLQVGRRARGPGDAGDGAVLRIGARRGARRGRRAGRTSGTSASSSGRRRRTRRCARKRSAPSDGTGCILREPARLPLVAQLLADAEGPIVAVTDFMKAVPEQIARFVARPFVPLGTDGVGRSDTREALRRYFEVDAPHVVVAVLSALAATGDVKPEVVQGRDRALRHRPRRGRPRACV